jgi:hypothetical protein
MKRRPIFLISLLVLCVLGVVFWFGANVQKPCPVNVQPESFDQLKLGMNENEIEAILGGPPGDYRRRADIGYLFSSSGNESQCLEGLSHVIRKEWNTDEYAIHIFFGPDDKAELILSAGGCEMPFPARNPVINILRRFFRVY